MVVMWLKEIKVLLIFSILFMVTKLPAQECEYDEYYSTINLARENYNKQDYKEAKKYYQLAFSKVSFSLGQDLSFALVVANKTNDDLWAKLIAEKLAKGGVPLKYFQKFSKEKWYSKFKSEFKDYSQYYSKNFNPELRQKLMDLLIADSNFNSDYHDWRIRKKEKSLQELIDGASEILLDFKELTEKFGFPNEKMMGYNYVKRTNLIEPYKINTLLIHVYQRGVSIFEKDISNIVCEGSLHPSIKEMLKEIQGHGYSKGIEQEMKRRYLKYRGTN